MLAPAAEAAEASDNKSVAQWGGTELEMEESHHNPATGIQIPSFNMRLPRKCLGCCWDAAPSCSSLKGVIIPMIIIIYEYYHRHHHRHHERHSFNAKPYSQYGIHFQKGLLKMDLGILLSSYMKSIRWTFWHRFRCSISFSAACCCCHVAFNHRRWLQHQQQQQQQQPQHQHQQQSHCASASASGSGSGSASASGSGFFVTLTHISTCTDKGSLLPVGGCW
ncbi:GL13130 [Drosophila persimilis]|uniref:GL13130 n=1 Tax=Drosophila persimilis TaxID=7234 RepID=B4GVB8_DROPE|nr:GL13130 [Drosophila persimilis]